MIRDRICLPDKRYLGVSPRRLRLHHDQRVTVIPRPEGTPCVKEYSPSDLTVSPSSCSHIVQRPPSSTAASHHGLPRMRPDIRLQLQHDRHVRPGLRHLRVSRHQRHLVLLPYWPLDGQVQLYAVLRGARPSRVQPLYKRRSQRCGQLLRLLLEQPFFSARLLQHLV
jgi:hypothetical protein